MMIAKTENGVKYCTNCGAYHSFPKINKNGSCGYCGETE